MYPSWISWPIDATPAYSHGLCYAAHTANLHTFWTGTPTTLLDVARCSPPLGFGGDPWFFFARCAPSVPVLTHSEPKEETLLDHLLRGPLLVGREGHALILKGYTPVEWLLIDTDEKNISRSEPFQYSLGI